jgi:hypothetical protein
MKPATGQQIQTTATLTLTHIVTMLLTGTHSGQTAIKTLHSTLKTETRTTMTNNNNHSHGRRPTTIGLTSRTSMTFGHEGLRITHLPSLEGEFHGENPTGLI